MFIREIYLTRTIDHHTIEKYWMEKNFEATITSIDELLFERFIEIKLLKKLLISRWLAARYLMRPLKKESVAFSTGEMAPSRISYCSFVPIRAWTGGTTLSRVARRR